MVEGKSVLSGNTLRVYLLVLKSSKPLGIREVQKLLRLSSPSVAQYHLFRLEQQGFIKRRNGNYAIGKLTLKHYIRISHYLIPRYLLYALFSGLLLIFQFTYLDQYCFNEEFCFSIVTLATFALIFCYETAKAWFQGSV